MNSLLRPLTYRALLTFRCHLRRELSISSNKEEILQECSIQGRNENEKLIEEKKRTERSSSVDDGKQDLIRTLIQNDSKSFQRKIRIKSEKKATIRQPKVEIQQPPTKDHSESFAALGDPDTFGTLSEMIGPIASSSQEYPEEESDDELDRPYLRLSKVDRKHIPTWYAFKMKKLAERGQYRDALDMFYNVMMEQDRVEPDEYCYRVAISICATIGDAKQAWKLFNEMKERGYTDLTQPFMHKVVTSLFEAFGKSVEREKSLYRATQFRRSLKEKGFSPNLFTYNSMMMAFARQGDYVTPFEIADEMLAAGLAPNEQSYAALLMAAAANVDSGFAMAVRVWQKLRRDRLKVGLHHYNLLLRAVRDCSVGPPDVAEKVLLGEEPQPQRTLAPLSLGPDVELIPSPESVPAARKVPASLIPTSAPDRLAYLGGIHGLLNEMKRCSLTPDTKTLSILVRCLGSSQEMENALVQLAIDRNYPLDTDFFNQLISRRNRRKDFLGAALAYDQLKERQLKPNMMTFGVVAMGCTTRQQGRLLLDEMTQLDIDANVQVLGALCYQASRRRLFRYLKDICIYMERTNIEPNAKILDYIEDALSAAKKDIVEMERMSFRARPAEKYESLRTRYNEFNEFYSKWLSEVQRKQESG